MDSVEIVTIGDELLSGLVVNTNAAYLCRELGNLGLTVRASHTLPDEPKALRRRLTRILQENTLVIATGGLGPTLDDNTRQVVAEIFNSGFRFDDGIAASLRERYGNDLATLQNQATVPSKAKVIPNDVGTAPALLFEANTVTLVLLPGIPIEMQAIFQTSVKPYLEDRLPQKAMYRKDHVLLTGVREEEVDPFLREVVKSNPDVAVGIYPRPGVLTVILSALESNGEATEVMARTKRTIVERFHDCAIPASTERIEEAIHQLFIERKLTLGTAESCTGGAVAARLTSLAGASEYFRGSVVSYSNDLKRKLLGVHEDTLLQHGAVSEDVAIEMVKGALEATGSDYSLAITGIAGPKGGSLQKPVGTVWIAIGNRYGVVVTWKLRSRGTRANIIESSVNAALCRLWLAVNYL